ncbi:MAG: type VI secretion system membrane subunit TssM [Zoogloeaceae bacterium]|jgi:type VI secretion system protein ImpL|nr:type VI secretion system membrane subunit TssM [Zoogloeaceae bacterium]
MFRKFLSALFSRQTLLILAFIVLGATVWFLGPLLSFGGLYPFASMGTRITALAFLTVLLLFILFRWPVSILGAAALCLLFWHLGPLLAIGNHHPFASIGARVGVIAFFLFCCLVYGLYRLWGKLRSDEELLNKFLRKSEKENRKDADQQARENLKAVGGIVSRAIAQLRQMHTRGGLLWRLFENKRYLYELPWYMLIGNPGAGKTTAILKSGLKFPLAEQMGQAFQSLGKIGAIAGEGGTKHCNWWFTSDAVMIDTAGRYTSQDSAPQIDSAEWLGFLDLLRKYRTQAPINGAILVLNAADLVDQDENARMVHASYLRERLLQLRQKLGIRFPVYVIVTKMDMLEGFEPYFGYLTSESRSQVWGFTLPYRHPRQESRSRGGNAATETQPDLAMQLEQHLSALAERLDAGLALRLQEEPDLERRRALYVFPQEFASQGRILAPFLEKIFLDSPYDATQLHNTLRGVYFTSGLQTNAVLHADPRTILQRLWRALRGRKTGASGAAFAEGATEREVSFPARAILPSRAPRVVTGDRGYFLAELFSRVIFPEASLVHLNLKREARYRALQLSGHALVLALAAWLTVALSTSFDNNMEYLKTVSGHAQALHERLLALFGRPASQEKDIPGTLDAARDLPRVGNLDLFDPPAAFRYGLYTPPPIVVESERIYAGLQDKLLLPYVVRRLESALREAIRTSDEKLVYDTLRVYLQLHDARRYKAEDVRAWLQRDWGNPGNANEFTSQIFVVEHIDRLFSGHRVVQSPFPANDSLVRQARLFLDAKPSPQRLYEQAKAEMSKEAPADFTLLQAIGPQAGTVFVRASGAPLGQGIPGLFTFDGYRRLFDKRLGEFIQTAWADDEWVMGRQETGLADVLEKTAREVRSSGLRSRLTDDALTQDLRRRYLTEYVDRWDAFLEDIRPVTGTSLSFDLTVVQKLAAPNSPLARLARAAVRETTLSREIEQVDPEKSTLAKAVESIDRQTRDVERNLGLRSQARVEREIVDNHFAALREIVTGQPDSGVQLAARGTQGNAGSGSITGAGSIVSLNNVIGMINEFHNQLFMANVALDTNTVPSNAPAAATKLKLDASRLPAPFRNVMMALAGNGDEKTTEGSILILRSQAEIQIDRTLAAFTYQIGNPCRQGLDGYYPFADSEHDVSIEDFTRMFAAGGSADEFFQKQIAPYVDTGTRPWRYRNPAALEMKNDLAASSPVAPPAANGPTLQGEYLKQLQRHIPDPDAFARIQAIRELFFRDPGAQKMNWKMDFKIIELDPAIVEFIINIDGQALRYVHGPTQAFFVNWPGPRGGTVAEMTANPRVRPDTSTIIAHGPWAVFRLLDRGKIINTANPDRVLVEYDFDNRKALLEISTGGQQNPLNSRLLRNFKCPGA